MAEDVLGLCIVPGTGGVAAVAEGLSKVMGSSFFAGRSRSWSARRQAVVGSVAALTLVPTLLGASAPGRVGGDVPGQALWQPAAVQKTASVPGRALAKPGTTAAQQAAKNDAAKPYAVPKVTWPSGSATATLTAAPPTGAAKSSAAVRAAVKAGSLPVTVTSTDTGSSAATAVNVQVLPQASAAKAGISGVLIGLVRADGATAASGVAVTVDYSAFAGGYGGGWADRLKLVSLPACALTTPQVKACQVQIPVTFTQNLATQTLTADIQVAGAQPANKSAARLQSAASGTGVRVLGVTATAAGSVGTYSATSLAESGSWSAGGNTGGFTYSYPITVPPSAGGAPSISLDYDSSAVDGKTSATNAQASWIGDGWDYSPGYVERSYEPCSQDDNETNVSDLCWAGNEVRLSLAGHSTTLVDDKGVWTPQSDDGTMVKALTGLNNGAYDGEGWEVITPDGTQYYFGANYLPGTTSTGKPTNSVFTEPVYCPNSGDGPAGDSCYAQATGTNSFAANLAWRWNLDYVVDAHGNLQTYSWTPETNYYDRGVTQGGGTGTNTIYDRGGYLDSISYGYRLSDAVAGTAPLNVVTFNTSQRCLTTATFTNCAYSNLNSTTAPNWPDVPFDQICASQTAACGSNTAPAFFSTVRLTSITTSVLVAGSPQPVDSYTLTQMFPAPQAGPVYPTTPGVSASNAGDGTTAVLWLSGIARTGKDTLGGGAAAPMPQITFTAMMMANRVDGATTGAAALFRPRMDYIDTESGSQIVVSYYAPQCSRLSNTMPASSDSDTMNCYAQYWTPFGALKPVLDWFNIYPVQAVTVNDLVAPAAWSEAQVTSYTYAGPAWHRDDSPLTASAQRTWDQFRGFRTVTTTVGAASAQSVPTQTVTTYLQGMDGDYLADGTQRSVTVHDNVGDTVTDSSWLQGQVLETDTLLGVGGAVESRSVSGPWTYNTVATELQADSMPSLNAVMQATGEGRVYSLWHDGTWKETQTNTTFDSSGRITSSDAKGDGTAAAPEVCTTTSYATSTSSVPNMIAFPDEVESVQGTCGTTATKTNTVHDDLTYYDSAAFGQLTSAGNVTETQSVDSYDPTTNKPVYVTETQGTYDVYGRVLTATDANGHTTTTVYSTPGTSPDTVSVTGPMGNAWTTVQTLDPARNLPISATDVNNELTTETYDGLGRLTAAWGPLHSQAGGAPADETFAYAMTGTSMSTVSTSTLLDDGFYSTDVQFYDGEDRVIQDQSPTADGSVGRLLTDTHFNSLGQTVKTTSPYSDTSSGPETTFFSPVDAQIPAETLTAYDGMGRTVTSSAVALADVQWNTTTVYKGTDETDVTPPSGSTATSTFTDTLGRTTATWAYNTAAPTGSAANADVTTYTYESNTNNVATIQDNATNMWTYSYDLHGRQIEAIDPGAGTSYTTYDAAGNVLTTTNGAGSQVTYQYDALNRKIAEYNTTPVGGVPTAPASANETAAWTYDTLEKGQPTAQIRYANGASDITHTYTESVTGYTALYQPTGQSVIIPSAEGKLAGTYQDSSLYTSETSMLAGTHYSAEGGLPKEAVNYAYSDSGILTAFGGTFSYLNNATYTPQGQILSTNFGVSGKQLNQYETYDSPTGRMLTVTDDIQSLASPLSTTSYTYNDAGSITSDSDAQYGVSTADTQCYTYDGQNRLTDAWTDTNGVTATTNSNNAQVLGTGGCNDATPAAAAGHMTGGPAPYDQAYTYDPLGDRTGETITNPATGAVASTQTLTYPGNNGTTKASQPDAVTTVATTGSPTTTYGYNAAGQTTSRGNQTFGYDAEGNTQSVTNTTTSTTSTYTYAPDGSLLLQRDPANKQVILYLPFGEQLTLNTTASTVSGLRYYTASPDGVSIVRSSTGTVYYELSDKLGTATADVNASTLAYAFRYFDPYGNPRGTVPSTWPDQHSYLGRPQDPSTSLDLLGAREYDSVTGRFLTVDPLLEAGDARQMNGYAYNADNPVNGADPTGIVGDWCVTLACVEQTGGYGSPTTTGNPGSSGGNNARQGTPSKGAGSSGGGCNAACQAALKALQKSDFKDNAGNPITGAGAEPDIHAALAAQLMQYVLALGGNISPCGGGSVTGSGLDAACDQLSGNSPQYTWQDLLGMFVKGPGGGTDIPFDLGSPLTQQLATDPHNLSLLSAIESSVAKSGFTASPSSIGGQSDYLDAKGNITKDLQGMGTNGKSGTQTPDAFLGSYDEVYQVININQRTRSMTVAFAAYNDTGMASLTHVVPDMHNCSSCGGGSSVMEEFYWTTTVSLG